MCTSTSTYLHLVVEAALRCSTTMASDVNVHAPAYPPSLLLGMWDNVSSPRPTPGALALTVVDTISRLQQSTQQQSTWELVLFYILLFPIIYLDNISSSSFIPVTHLMSDGPSSFSYLPLNSLHRHTPLTPLVCGMPSLE